jgi:hypothetical protein
VLRDVASQIRFQGEAEAETYVDIPQYNTVLTHRGTLRDMQLHVQARHAGPGTKARSKCSRDFGETASATLRATNVDPTRAQAAARRETTS